MNFADINFMNDLLKWFTEHSIQGMLALQPQAKYLILVLGIIDLCTTWTLYEGDVRLSKIISRVMKIGFFFFMVVYWNDLCHMVFKSFMTAGAVASGIQTTSGDWFTPSGIISKAFEVIGTASNGKDTGLLGALYHCGITDIGKVTMYGSTILVTLCAFAFMSFQVLFTNIEFTIFCSIGVILLPFGSIRFTSFLFQRVVSAIFSFGIKLMVTYFILGLIGSKIDTVMAIKPDGSFAEMIQMAFSYLVLGFIMLKVPSLAASMMNGQPSLDGGAFVKGAAAGAISVATGTTAARAAGATAGLGSATMRAASATGKTFAANGGVQGLANLGKAAMSSMNGGGPQALQSSKVAMSDVGKALLAAIGSGGKSMGSSINSARKTALKGLGNTRQAKSFKDGYNAWKS